MKDKATSKYAFTRSYCKNEKVLRFDFSEQKLIKRVWRILRNTKRNKPYEWAEVGGRLYKQVVAAVVKKKRRKNELRLHFFAYSNAHQRHNFTEKEKKRRIPREMSTLKNPNLNTAVLNNAVLRARNTVQVTR